MEVNMKMSDALRVELAGEWKRILDSKVVTRIKVSTYKREGFVDFRLFMYNEDGCELAHTEKFPVELGNTITFEGLHELLDFKLIT